MPAKKPLTAKTAKAIRARRPRRYRAPKPGTGPGLERLRVIFKAEPVLTAEVWRDTLDAWLLDCVLAPDLVLRLDRRLRASGQAPKRTGR